MITQAFAAIGLIVFGIIISGFMSAFLKILLMIAIALAIMVIMFEVSRMAITQLWENRKRRRRIEDVDNMDEKPKRLPRAKYA